MIIHILCLYIGFTVGLSLMDYIDIKDQHYLHMCKYSLLHPFLAILFSPLNFPFYLVILISDKIKGNN